VGCWHGWHDGHGCAPWHRAPFDRAWYGPVDWYDEADWPTWRPSRRGSRPDRAAPAEAIEARLDELREEMSRLEADLEDLRGVRPAAGRP